MFNYLIGHARRNVWCTPRQDLQVIFTLARLTRPGGEIATMNHLWSRLKLPTNDAYYHVFQIGQLTPTLIGLLPDSRKWVKISDVMADEEMIIDLYFNDGLHLSRTECYYMFSEERNLIIAVRDQPRIGDAGRTAVHIRFYSNAFFQSPRSSDYPHSISCHGRRMDTVQAGLDFQNQYLLSRAKPGYTWLFVDGAFVDNFIPQNTPIGAMLEFVYDSTVKAVVDYPIATTPTFDSIQDLKRKYLLHYEQDQVDGDMIDYRDDIDVYLIRKYTRGSNPEAWDGIYYHKNQNDALRMVTHRDYAITVPYVVNYQQQRPGWNDIMELTVRLFIRHSGYKRPLVRIHNRIQDLYRLSSEQVVLAMYGTQATVPVWQAPNLENSYYTKIMDAAGRLITSEMVQKAYGYNTVSKLMADTPQFIEVVSGRRQVSLPPGLWENSTVYEYDANGFLIDYHYHAKGAEYTPFSPDCVLIEALVGRGRVQIPATYDQQSQTIDPELDYRFYIADKVGNTVKDDTWRDVTGDTTKYGIVGNQMAWAIDMSKYATVVVSNLDFMAYKLPLAPANGLLKFSIGFGTHNYFIPPGKLDIWLNNKALIEDLDYHVRWPQVIIHNKEYLVPGNEQLVDVRATGFCKADLTREPPAEVGFVKHGRLSRNGYFNLRDDKVVRLVVKGATYERSQLSFVEDEGSVEMPEEMNGFPYLIENVVVPLRGLVDGEDTYSYRAKSLVVDQQVADYLNSRLPEPPEPNPNMSLERYMIYSPFSSSIIHDLVNGVIAMDQFQGHYADRDVIDRLENYRYLLEYDPTQYPVDLDYVIIHPHNLMTEIRLDDAQWRFISRAVKIFLENKVDLSRFIVIQ